MPPVLLRQVVEEMIQNGSKEEQAAMFAYGDAVKREQASFVDYAASQVSLSDAYTTQAKQLDDLKRMYTGVMLLLCMTPLAKGVHPNTVLKAAGFYLSCMAFSDVFREEAGKTLKETFLPCVEDRVARDGRIGFTKEESEWMQQKDRVQQANACERVVWTPDSAAVMQLAYWKQMYEQSLVEKDRLEELRKDYETKSSALAFDAGQDGVTQSRMEQQTVQIAGMLEQKDAESYACFHAYVEQMNQIQMRRNLNRLSHGRGLEADVSVSKAAESNVCECGE